MEMTFPHPVARQSALPQPSHQAMLAAVIARQASSPTARAVLAAKTGASDSSGDATQQRIHYFGSPVDEKNIPSGAFWATRRTHDTGQVKYEAGVYQDASNYGKAPGVMGDGTGDQFNPDTEH